MTVTTVVSGNEPERAAVATSLKRKPPCRMPESAMGGRFAIAARQVFDVSQNVPLAVLRHWYADPQPEIPQYAAAACRRV